MNALVNVLPAFFKPSFTQPDISLNRRAVDPSSNANHGFSNNPSQKTSFPAGTSKPTSTAAQASSSSASVSASASITPVSSSSPIPTTTSAILPPPPVNVDSSITQSPSATISPSSAADSSNSSSGGLSGGAIGAIVAVIVIVVGGLMAFFFVRRRRQKRMAAQTGAASAMRDPYNEGFGSFPPPPPAPMAFTSSDYLNTNSAAGSAHYQQQDPYSQQQQYSTSYNYPTTNPPSTTAYPITAPDMISTPPMASANAPATMISTIPSIYVGATAAAATVNQQPQPGDIWQQPPLGTFTVMTTYAPTLSDEIDVQPNDQVQIFEEYDDGWCLGVNLTRGQTRGVFPKHCVTPDQQPLHHDNPSSQSLAVSDPSGSGTTTTTTGKRVSSLYMDNPSPTPPQ